MSVDGLLVRDRLGQRLRKDSVPVERSVNRCSGLIERRGIRIDRHSGRVEATEIFKRKGLLDEVLQYSNAFVQLDILSA